MQIPRRRLIVLGAVHISQALAPMAKLADIEMIIVDPRTAFATPDRFPDVDLIPEWPQDALPRLGLDAFTGLAALTHDPKIDDPGFDRGTAFGALLYRRARLAENPCQAARSSSWRGIFRRPARRHSQPVGLDIGAVQPAEIAVSFSPK